MIKFDEPTGLLSDDGSEMSLKGVKAFGEINGLMLEMTVRQHYKNDSNKPLETTYTFPMAWGATFMSLNVEIDGKRLTGFVCEKQEATNRYEEAISSGDAPIMLEKNSDGIYTLNLGNLKPNEEAIIEYRYCQLLKIEQGSTRISIPTNIAPRYGDSRLGGIREEQGVETNPIVEYPFNLSIQIKSEMAKSTVNSPSHQIQTKMNDDGVLVELARNGYLDRDFILQLSDVQSKSFVTVYKDPHVGENGYAVLASFCPSIPKVEKVNVDLKILVDCSGSMAGDSIRSAKNALVQIFNELVPGDRFSYSKFGTSVNHIFTELRPANKLNLIAAKSLIEQTEADMGGTEIEGALTSTFALQGTEGKSNVLLITDGEVWDTDNIVKAALKSGHRIFAIGVGSAPAETLLKELAEKTGGACELVSPNEDISAAIIRMFHRIHLPTASDISVNWGIDPSWESDLPISVFEGDTIHVFANFDSPITKTPTLSFKQGSQSFDIQSEEIHVGSPELPRLAATSRMANATNISKLGLAILYQLVSDQTNYILVHERTQEVKATEFPELQKIQQMQTAGWGGINTVVDSSISNYSPRVMMDMQSFDSPPLFRMIRKDSMESFDSLFELSSNSMTSHDINHSKVYDSIESFEPPPKAITPREMIEQASMIIDHERNLTEFVEAMECERMDPELEFCLAYLKDRSEPEKMWAMILGWLLIRVQGAKWNPKTKQVIESYIEDFDDDLVPEAFEMFAAQLGAVTLLSWSDY